MRSRVHDWPAVANLVAQRHRRSRAVLARLRELEAGAYVNAANVLIHLEIPLIAPVVVWEPGSTPPDFGPVTYRLQRRWAARVQPEIVVAISSSGAAEFGGYRILATIAEFERARIVERVRA